MKHIDIVQLCSDLASSKDCGSVLEQCQARLSTQTTKGEDRRRKKRNRDVLSSPQKQMLRSTRDNVTNLARYLRQSIRMEDPSTAVRAHQALKTIHQLSFHMAENAHGESSEKHLHTDDETNTSPEHTEVENIIHDGAETGTKTSPGYKEVEDIHDEAETSTETSPGYKEVEDIHDEAETDTETSPEYIKVENIIHDGAEIDSSPVFIEKGTSPMLFDANTSPILFDANTSPVSVENGTSPMLSDIDTSPIDTDTYSVSVDTSMTPLVPVADANTSPFIDWEEVTKLQRENDALQEQMAHLMDEITQLNKETNNLREEVSSLRRSNEHYKEQVHRLQMSHDEDLIIRQAYEATFQGEYETQGTGLRKQYSRNEYKSLLFAYQFEKKKSEQLEKKIQELLQSTEECNLRHRTTQSVVKFLDGQNQKLRAQLQECDKFDHGNNESVVT